MNLTRDQIRELSTIGQDYLQIGFEKRLFKPSAIPYKAPDELEQTVSNISGQVPVEGLNIRSFVKKSGAVRVTTEIDNGDTATIDMILTLKFSGFTLAIPRWSVFYPDDSSSANEIGVIGGISAINDILINSYRSFEQVNNKEQRHYFSVTIQNNTGVNNITFAFKGDWLYFGSTA